MARLAETWAGLLAGVLGTAALAYAVFGPTVRYQQASAAAGGGTAVPVETNMVAEGMPAVTAAMLVGLFLLILAVPLLSALHAQADFRPALPLLWLVVLALVGAGGTALAGVGLLFLPAAGLALLAASAGSLVQRRLPREVVGKAEGRWR